jgi:hypothetical protein
LAPHNHLARLESSFAEMGPDFGSVIDSQPRVIVAAQHRRAEVDLEWTLLEGALAEMGPDFTVETLTTASQ